MFMFLSKTNYAARNISFPSATLMHGRDAMGPLVPVVARMLLVLAFIEDAFCTLLQYDDQTVFFRLEYAIPPALSLPLIGLSTSAMFLGAVMIFLKPIERRGAQLLLLSVVYQQVVYGWNSPITSGNIGFFLRNLCLIGTLCLFIAHSRVHDGLPILPELSQAPTSLKDAKCRDAAAFGTRLLIALHCVEMLFVVPRSLILIIVPIALALFCGYRTNVIGVLLLLIYLCVTFSTKKFWLISSSSYANAAFERDVMRYEFFQSISITSGLLLLIKTGPGDLSLDNQLMKSA